jgi:nucleolar protein 56
LYNTSFIGRAIGKNKGKISRYLANKCAMAARLDHFLVNPTRRFGEMLKEQVEKRLAKTDDNE